jgi:hypothetical protein
VTSPGPSKEYQDLLKGKISPDQYVREVKKDVDRRLENKTATEREQRRAATR